MTPTTSSEKNSKVCLNPSFKTRLHSAGVRFALVLILFAPFGLGAEQTALHKKNIPAITYKNLFPPYKNYEYLQNRKIVPFEYGASSFSLVNAWWLAEASTLVYADEAYARPRFKEAGLKRIIFINRSGTQCFIASNNRFAIVAFRGSEIWNKEDGFDPGQMVVDFMTDIDIRLSDWTRGGKVHSGFKTALDNVWNDILPEIKRLRDRGIPIWVTGHSLGAALATLAADRLQKVQGLYTFGSPRVGDREFQKKFALKAYRVVNGKDLVADIPPQGPYRHVGEYIFIDQEGIIHAGHRASGKSDNASRLSDSNSSEHAGEVQKSDSAFYIPDSIRDHVPVIYCTYLWNKLVVSLTGYEIPKMTQTANKEGAEISNKPLAITNALGKLQRGVQEVPLQSVRPN